MFSIYKKPTSRDPANDISHRLDSGPAPRLSEESRIVDLTWLVKLLIKTFRRK